MSSSERASGDGPRKRAIEDVVRDYRRRLEAGEPVARDQVVAEHPELEPELGEALGRVGRTGSSTEHPPDAPTLVASHRDERGGDDRDGARVEPTEEGALEGFPGYYGLRVISYGGQGTVYRATQEGTKRQVAIKVLHKHQYGNASAQKRFEREMEVAAQLQHPYLVNVFHTGRTTLGRLFYVMDHVEGRPLHEYVRKEQLTVEDTLKLFVKVCRGVAYAHQHGVLHRDLKPGNILVESGGQPRVVDFGLAKRVEGAGEEALTASSDLVGTLPYLSPEQTTGDGDPVDARADVYALGVILYQLLTGQLPYAATGTVDVVLRRIREVSPPPLRRGWSPLDGVQRSERRVLPDGECPLDREIETIVLGALAKEAQRRYPSAGELADDVERYLTRQPVRARRDNVVYVLWAKARSGMSRHPVLTAMLGLLLVVFVSQEVVARAVYDWTSLNRRYEAWLAPLPASQGAPALERVRVVALHDRTPIAALADEAGLADVDASNVKSLRRLHGEFMRRLVGSELRVLAWDISFWEESDFDDTLVSGASAIREQEADLVLAAPDWRVDDEGLPPLSRPLLAQAKWGAITADLSGDRPWALDLFVRRGPGDLQPSLALASATAFRQPGAEPFFELDWKNAQLVVRYWVPADMSFRGRKWLTEVDRFRVSEIAPLHESNPDFGLQAGDQVGYFVFAAPSDALLAEATHTYEDVFRAGPDDLRAWFAGRLVFVGDTRGDLDLYPHPDGREIHGVYAHAIAAEALVSGVVALRYPSIVQAWVIIALVAVVGFSIAYSMSRKRVAGAVVVAGCCGVICLISVEACRSQGVLFNPLVPVITLLMAAGLAYFMRVRLQTHRYS